MADSEDQTLIERPARGKLNNKKWLQLTADLTKIAIFDWNLQNGRVFANKHFRSLFGYSEDDTIVGAELLDDRIHPEDLPLLKQRLAEAQDPDEKNHYHFKFRALLPDGTQKWVQTFGEVFFTGKGKERRAVRVFGTGIDITERSEAKNELRKSKERHRAFVAANSDVVYRMNSDWTKMLQLEGPAFHSDTHKSNDTWVQKYIPESDRQQVRKAIDEAVQTKSAFELEHRVLMNDGDIGWTSSYAVPLVDDEGEIYEWFGTATDITERKRREKRDQFLVKLNDILQPLSDPVEIQQRVSRLLANHFKVDRAFYAEITENETIAIASDYGHGNMPSIVGRYRLEAFGQVSARTLQAGETLTFADIETADMTAEGKKAYNKLQVSSMVKVPLVKEGRLKAFLGLHQSAPREWSSNEVKLVEETAERTWAAVERARAEEALREREERYHTLFNSIDEGFCIIEMLFNDNSKPDDYRFLEINETFEKQTGLKNAVGKRMKELAPKHEEHWFDIYGKVAMTGEPVRFENEAREMGEYHYYDVFATRIGGKNSRIVAILFNDIIERKRREQRDQFLLDLSDRLRNLKDEEEIDRACTQLLASELNLDRVYFGHFYAEEERVQLGPEYHSPGLDPVSGWYDYSDFPEAIKEQETETPVYDDTANDSRLPEAEKQALLALGFGAWMCVPVRAREKKIDLALYAVFSEPHQWTLHDITLVQEGADRTWTAVERARAEEALRKSEADLKEMNETLEERVEERTSTLLSYQKQLRSLADQLSKAEENERQQLAGELHDNLGQLLALCKMKIDFLPKKNGEVEEAIELINEAIRYTRKLMSDLKPPPSLEEEDLITAMEWAAKNMEKHDLKVSICDDGNPKKLDEESRSTVVKAVRELLLNVVKHANTDEAQLNLMRKDNQIRIIVEDEGTGFDPGEQQSEESLKEGFGLFNIYERIDLLGGDFNIDSAPGEGTRAIVTVPALREYEDFAEEGMNDSEQNSQMEINNKEDTQKTIKVLLADDHQIMREGLRKIIEGEDDLTTIAEAADGKEALQLAKETAPDVIVMDINMPEMNGIDATQQIKEELPEIQVVGLSFYDDKDVTEDMRKAGASAFVSKTEASETLCATIRSEAGGQ